MIPILALGTIITAQAADAPQLTVYNGGFALVKEQRTFNLQSGTQTVAVTDVAAMIEANSVAIKSLTNPGSITVLEQNYQYDLISPQAILQKAVGQEIVFNRVLPNGVKERLVGTLMAAPTNVISDPNGNQSTTWNGMVIQTNDGRVVLNPSGEIEVSSIPNGLISKPTLMWMLNAAQAGQNTLQLSYLTRGMSWKSDYVMTLDKEGSLADLKGWVTLTNNSGTTFNGAQLKLLAGDVQRAPQGPGAVGRGGGAMFEDKAMEAMQQESFADYHLYTLPRATDVKNREIKQVSLLEGKGIKVTRKLLIDVMRGFNGYYPNEGEVGTGPIKPSVFYEFVNSEENQLGMPLPGGTFKIFQPDSTGSIQLVGEDRIDHTPKDEKLSIRVGQAFDIRAERKRTEFRWLDNNRRRGAVETFEIEVRNRKETPDTVYIIERHWGDHTISNSTIQPTKLSSEAYEFKVDLAPDEVKTITYTVTTRW